MIESRVPVSIGDEARQGGCVPTAPRRILLAVSGMSPQIITETLYVLITQENAWIPHEVRLITTLQGKHEAVSQLLEGKRHFQRLLDDYRVSQPIRFDSECISLIQDAHGHELADLRTPPDNAAAADTIVRVIRELTSDVDTELHVSLAGGRKTMGFYAGYALSLFGRAQDCLSHVLVSEHYESNPHFFYRTAQSHTIKARNGEDLDASTADIWLADIPFVRLRSRLPATLLKGTHSFSETVRLAREATESVRLTLYPGSRRYRVNGRDGELSPVQMGMLLWVATRMLDNHPPVEPVVEGETRSADEFFNLAKRHGVGLNGKTYDTLEQDGITQKWLEQTVSKLNRSLADTLGAELAERCKLASRTIRGSRGYALPEDLDVHVEPDAERDGQEER